VPAPKPIESFHVPPGNAEERLDRYLADRLEGTTRSRLQRWIREGRVRVNGMAVARPGTLLAAGAEIEVERPTRRLADGAMERAAALQVLFEDEHLLALDKPAGLLVHPGAGEGRETLAQLANLRFGPLPCAEDADRPGIVHRLDQDTSGVILLARTAPALLALQAQFRERHVRKTYMALVHGDPRFDSDWIETPIGSDTRRPGKFKVVAEGEGREAATFYETRERFGDFACLAVRPLTGRTHQIRVHLASIGHSIVGDSQYRSKGSMSRVPEEAPVLGRQALHAEAIEFEHPATGEAISLEAPLPADLSSLVSWFRDRPGAD
jgi:23S rRNA pseudouridine1911/1915/1917 synthase